MLRFLPLFALALALPACTGNDKPTLSLSVDDSSMLSITLERGDDHVFGKIHATVNGIDAGYATVTKGNEGITFSQASSGATATWQLDMAPLGEAVHVVVTEDSDTFTLDAPTLGAPRTPQLLTSLAAPIAPGDFIQVTTGIATDRVTGGFEIKAADGSSCTVQWDTNLAPGSVSLGLATPDNLQYDWWCGDYPAPGTLVKATISLDVDASPKVTSCTGDDLTCSGVTTPTLHVDAPIAIQF